MTAATDDALLHQIERIEKHWRRGRTWQAISLARQAARAAVAFDLEEEIELTERQRVALFRRDRRGRWRG